MSSRFSLDVVLKDIYFGKFKGNYGLKENKNIGLELLNLSGSSGTCLSRLLSFYRLTGCYARDISEIDSLFLF